MAKPPLGDEELGIWIPSPLLAASKWNSLATTMSISWIGRPKVLNFLNSVTVVFTRAQGACGGSLSSDLTPYSTAGTSSCYIFRLQSTGPLHLCPNGLSSQSSSTSLSGRQTLTHSTKSACRASLSSPIALKGRQAALEGSALLVLPLPHLQHSSRYSFVPMHLRWGWGDISPAPSPVAGCLCH